jgi:ABC-2 type transport system ATP-binding protein
MPMISIEASSVCLDYPLIGVGNHSLRKRLLGAATGGLISFGESVPVIKALRDVSLSIQEGDRLGLIGHNGAGKSTLLKVLAGIYPPTAGHVRTKGQVVSTLNLSLGMSAEATGYENIVIRGLLLGMSRVEIERKIDEIAEFTELGEYLDLPVRIYSSGMQTRLAFATVTSMDADILLMDELIGTGDAAFMEKTRLRLDTFMSRSKIIVLASHSEAIIGKLCNKALLLEHGRVIAAGSPDEVIAAYRGRAVESLASET